MFHVTSDSEFAEFCKTHRASKPAAQALAFQSYIEERLRAIFTAVADRPISLNNLIWPIHICNQKPCFLMISAEQQEHVSKYIAGYTSTFLLVEAVLYDTADLLFRVDRVEPETARLALSTFIHLFNSRPQAKCL